MDEQHPPTGRSQDNYHITAESVGAVGPGSHGSVTKNVYGGGPPLDVEAFKASLTELYKALGHANLPDAALMEAQGTVGQVVKAVQQTEVQPSTVAEQLQQVGGALAQANATIEQGSQLAASIQKIAKIAAPFLGVAAHVVAGWFGLPMP